MNTCCVRCVRWHCLSATGLSRGALSTAELASPGRDMAEPAKIPRHALGVLLAAQVALLLRHLERLPLWVGAVWIVCAGWRVRVHQGRWALPGGWIKVGLVAACLAGIRMSYHTVVGLEPTVTLLLACF